MNRQQKVAERIAEYFHEDPVKSMYGGKAVSHGIRHHLAAAPVLQTEGLSMEERRQTINDAFAWLKHQMVRWRVSFLLLLCTQFVCVLLYKVCTRRASCSL